MNAFTLATNDLYLRVARRRETYVRAFFGHGPAEYLSRREMEFIAEGWTFLACTPEVMDTVPGEDEYRVTVTWSMGLWPREQTLADTASWGWFGGDL